MYFTLLFFYKGHLRYLSFYREIYLKEIADNYFSAVVHIFFYFLSFYYNGLKVMSSIMLIISENKGGVEVL